MYARARALSHTYTHNHAQTHTHTHTHRFIALENTSEEVLGELAHGGVAQRQLFSGLACKVSGSGFGIRD